MNNQKIGLEAMKNKINPQVLSLFVSRTMMKYCGMSGLCCITSFNLFWTNRTSCLEDFLEYHCGPYLVHSHSCHSCHPLHNSLIHGITQGLGGFLPRLVKNHCGSVGCPKRTSPIFPAPIFGDFQACHKCGVLPTGNMLHSYWKWPFLMGKTHYSMAMFNSFAKLPEGTRWPATSHYH